VTNRGLDATPFRCGSTLCFPVRPCNRKAVQAPAFYLQHEKDKSNCNVLRVKEVVRPLFSCCNLSLWRQGGNVQTHSITRYSKRRRRCREFDRILPVRKSRLFSFRLAILYSLPHRHRPLCFSNTEIHRYTRRPFISIGQVASQEEPLFDHRLIRRPRSPISLWTGGRIGVIHAQCGLQTDSVIHFRSQSYSHRKRWRQSRRYGLSEA
jgi:hypothetical protein